MLKQSDPDGKFRRQDAQFRSFVSKDPNAEFPAERDRYVLYLNYGCPWLVAIEQQSVPMLSVYVIQGPQDKYREVPQGSRGCNTAGKNLMLHPLLVMSCNGPERFIEPVLRALLSVAKRRCRRGPC